MLGRPPAAYGVARSAARAHEREVEGALHRAIEMGGRDQIIP